MNVEFVDELKSAAGRLFNRERLNRAASGLSLVPAPLDTLH